MPDPLSPLFAPLGLPAFSRATRALAPDLAVGGMFPGDVLTTVNGYAYYQFDLSLRQIIPLLRVTSFVLGLLRTAEARWAEEARPAYAAVTETWEGRNLSAASTTSLLDGAREILDVAGAYYLTLQSGLLPSAYMTEALFSQVYERLWRRRGDPPAL